MGRKKKSEGEGIDLELSVSVNNFQKDMREIKKEVNATGGELKAIQDILKKEWSMEKFQKGMTLAKQNVEATADRVQKLKDRLAEINEKGLQDKLADEVKRLTTDLTYAERAAHNAAKELVEMSNIRFDRLSKQFDEVSDRINKWGKNLSMYVTAPILAAGTASFKMASDMQESINKVDTVFGDSSEMIKGWANTTLEAYGIANMTALEMTAFFGDMATSMGYSEKQAAEMSKRLVALAGDVASFKNISLEQVQTALQGIFTGNTASLKLLGVVMTEANVEAHALSLGLQQNWKDLSQNEKVAYRYDYVMKMLANSQGDFANTIESPSNQIRLFQESVKQLAASFGNELLPMLTPFIKNANELVKSFVNLDSGSKKLVVQIAVAAATLGPMLMIGGQLNKIISAGISLMAMLTAKTTAKAVADGVATKTQYALNAAMAANPIGAVITAITTIIALLLSYAASASLTAEKTKSLNEVLKDTAKSFESASRSIEETARSEEAELAMVERLIPEYEELNKKVGKSAGEKRELKNIVDKINSVIPDSINLINSETGQYEANTQAIANNINAIRLRIQAKADEERAIKAYSNQSEILEKTGFSSLEKLKEEAEKLKNSSGNARTGIGGFIDSFFADYDTSGTSDESNRTRLNNLQKAISDIEEYEAIIKKGEESIKAYGSQIGTITTNSFLPSGNSSSSGGTSDLAKAAADAAEAAEKARKEAERLAEETRRAEEQQRKENLSNFEKYVNEVAKLAQKAADEKVKALDREAAAYDRLNEKQNQEKKLAEARKQLAFTSQELDNENYNEIQKHIARLEKEIKEREFKENIEAQKEAIQNQMAAIQTAAQTSIGRAQAALAPTNSPSEYNISNLISVAGLSQAQAEVMIQNALSKLLNGV